MCQKKLDTMRNAGVKVNGIWAQDWSGIRMTSFGKRVMWNWKWNSENYPQLDSRIKQWNKEGVQFLAYINPYVASDKDLCEEAAKRGYLAKDAAGGDYLVEFGEFYGGVVDLTNPEAYAWFKEVIKKNMIELGCGGWMADFGSICPPTLTCITASAPKLCITPGPRCGRNVTTKPLKKRASSARSSSLCAPVLR